MPLPDLQEPLALLEQKEIDAAIEMLEQKVSALPAHLVAHVLLARAYEAQQRWDQALRSWENAHFLMPNSPVVEEGKRRVLRRMDGIEDDAERSMVTAPETDEPAETAPEEVAPEETTPAETAEEDAEEEETSEEDTSSETETSSELAQLRRQAEREARQGGARSGLSEESPTIDSPSPEEPSATPEEQVEKLEEEDSADDLDRLIGELESARIEPDPDTEEAPEPDLEDDTEDVVSETLARIHASQNNYREAARIYDKLALQDPDRAEEFREKAAEMREKAGVDDDSTA